MYWVIVHITAVILDLYVSQTHQHFNTVYIGTHNWGIYCPTPVHSCPADMYQHGIDLPWLGLVYTVTTVVATTAVKNVESYSSPEPG
jgi:hypothetical protein